MLYYLFDYLEKQANLAGAGLFQYISFRAGAAIIISLIISMVFGGRIIRSLKKLQVGESVRDLGLDGQKEKEGTPTMGGILILVAILVPLLLLAKLDNIYIIIMLVTSIWLAGIGFIDDYIKIFKKNKKGLAGKYKVVGQVLLGIFVGCVMLVNQDITVRMPVEEAQEKGYKIVEQYTLTIPSINGPMERKEMAYVKSTLTNIPFVKDNMLDYEAIVKIFSTNSAGLAWIVFIPVVIFIVTAVSNAANLTDGIDGLATGISAIIGATLGVLAYVSGNAITADYLNILYLPHSEELVVFAACFLGASIGFLWHNSYPAKVFMGDTGSLMLGGVIAIFAILLRKELLIPILCGIFLMENVSVMLQVGYFKYTRKKYGEGRRIFKMSPLHHHYQKLGMHESKIVTRFWIVQILLAILTIITLKIR